jgi:hypothetical protein
MAEGPNSLDSEAGVRPDRANATICCLNSGVYRTVLSAIVNSSCYNGEVSTKPGQLQSDWGGDWRRDWHLLPALAVPVLVTAHLAYLARQYLFTNPESRVKL